MNYPICKSLTTFFFYLSRSPSYTFFLPLLQVIDVVIEAKERATEGI